MFSPQIHIIFNAREDQRIIKPLIENPPNKLYYFTAMVKSTNQADVNLEFYNKNVETLKKHIPSLEIITNPIDYTNYIEIIQELSKLIKFEREMNSNSKFFINVSSGSKMTSIASVEAAKLWNCEVYYLYSSNYDPCGEGVRHKGIFYIIEPITFPIKKPDESHIKTLKLIINLIEKKYYGKESDEKSKKYIYMKELINELYEKEIIKLEREHKDPSYRKSALYQKVKNYLQPIIKDFNYIKISDDKRNKKVFITKRGKQVLEIFKYYY